MPNVGLREGLKGLRPGARVWRRRKGCGGVCRVWGRDRPCLTLLSEPVKRKKRKSLASKKIVFGLREKRKEKERYLRDFLPGNSLQTNRACGSVCRVGGRDRRCLTLGCGRVGRVWGRRNGCGRVCRVWGRDWPCLTLLSEPVKRKKRKSLASKKIVFGLREKRKEKERYLRDFLPGNSLQTNRACGSVCRVGGRDRRCLTLGCGRVWKVWGRAQGFDAVERAAEGFVGFEAGTGRA